MVYWLQMIKKFSIVRSIVVVSGRRLILLELLVSVLGGTDLLKFLFGLSVSVRGD